jgi:hypothetical protein
MSKRKVRTLAERLEAAKREAVRVEQLGIKQATELVQQGDAWHARSIELGDKAQGAWDKAVLILNDLGIEPIEFIAGVREDQNQEVEQA